jgi:hypothetical protein
MATFWDYEHKFNFHDALGDTIMEKFEHLYVTIFQLKNLCGSDILHLIVGKNIKEIFETVSAFKKDVTLVELS